MIRCACFLSVGVVAEKVRKALKVSIMGICMENALREGMPIEDFLAACKQLGADGVELASRHLPTGNMADTAAALRKVADTYRK
ncbi:MAG: hypothetical protein GXP25_11950 [Planctomycetes bacterium]|nr:hypothetical protein [Planctomycetota bacterium]